jgi:peptide-methionine (R)-S-oxide reductase
MKKIKKTDEEWKKVLTDEEYEILRKKGTEPPFTGKYANFKKKGIYICAGCGNELFSSDVKYESGSGWPSFNAPISNDKIELKKDKSLGMNRTEVLCRKCSGHLGHVFNDGPAPTGLRFYINSTSLDFKEKK